jgi:serine/threonine-protein kinase
MDSMEARALARTETALSPFFSPDGQWVAFFAGGNLRKVPVAGGAVLTLAPTPNARGGAWGADDTIVFAPTTNASLTKVSAAGGEMQRFSTLKVGEAGHRWPQFLPDGGSVLFTVDSGGNADDWQIAVQPRGATEHKILVLGGTYGRYVPSGHLVYYRAGTIMAVPFDLDRLELRGTPAPAQEGVMSSPGDGAGQFSFSDRGMLAYIPGRAAQGEFELVWVDRNGRSQNLPTSSRVYSNVRPSPDGQRAAFELENDIWIYDLSRGTQSRLTFEGVNATPLWTPDSQRIAFTSIRGKSSGIYWKLANGTGREEVLSTSAGTQNPSSFTPDGKTLMYNMTSAGTLGDLWVMPLNGERKAIPYLQTPAGETTGRISPDGRWVAYLSNESGQNEIYVRPFPDANGGKWQISIGGGAEIVWGPSSKELFYRTGPNREKMMVVDIQTQPNFAPGRPRELFDVPYYSRVSNGADYGVSPDGQRFLMIKNPERGAASPLINVVLNWFEELKQKVPTGR